MATARISATGLPIPQGGIGDILEGGRYMGPPRVLAGGSGGSGSNIIKGIISALTKDDVITGEDLANIPVEEREAKKAEKKKQIRTVQGSRAAGMTAEEQRAAAERGDFGPLEMSKKDDDEIIEVKDEELIREEKKDVSTGGEDPDEDPNEKTIIFDDPQTTARKLVEQEIQQLVNKSIKKLKDKYKEIGKQKEFELYEEDPSNLEDAFFFTGDKDSLKADLVSQIYNDNKDTLPFTTEREGVISIMDLIKNTVPNTNSVKTVKKILKSQDIVPKRTVFATTESLVENLSNMHEKQKEQYDAYMPIIIETFTNNSELELKDLTKLINERIGPVTRAGGEMSSQYVANVLQNAGLREKRKIYSDDTKEQILNYLLENDRYKTISSTQVMKDLNLKEGEDISLDVIRTLRQTGFPNFSVEGYDNTSLVATENINPRNLDKARVVFQSALKKNYKNLAPEEINRLTQVFSDYITDAFIDRDKSKGFTQEMITEAYNYATTERMVPTFEEQIYQEFFADLRKKNLETMALVNEQRISEGKKPFENLKQFQLYSSKKGNPDLYLTMGHARLGAAEGQMGFADLRNLEPETMQKNMRVRNYGKQLVKLWGKNEEPDNLEAWLEVAEKMVSEDMRHIFQIPNSNQTILIGREEPKPFPSEEKIFEFKKDGGMVGINYMTRPLNA